MRIVTVLHKYLNSVSIYARLYLVVPKYLEDHVRSLACGIEHLSNLVEPYFSIVELFRGASGSVPL
jgi:hypothetical protein